MLYSSELRDNAQGIWLEYFLETLEIKLFETMTLQRAKHNKLANIFS